MAWSNLAVEILGEFGSYSSGESIEQQVRKLGGHTFGAGDADWKRFKDWEAIAYQRGTERYLKRLERKSNWARAQREEMAALCGFTATAEARDRRNARERQKRADAAIAAGRTPGLRGRAKTSEEMRALALRGAAKQGNFGTSYGPSAAQVYAEVVISLAEREGRVVRRRSARSDRDVADHGDRVDGAAQGGREAHVGQGARALVGGADAGERRHDDRAGAGDQ